MRKYSRRQAMTNIILEKTYNITLDMEMNAIICKKIFLFLFLKKSEQPSKSKQRQMHFHCCNILGRYIFLFTKI